ncbi:MAG: amidohydrolase family protein [Alphaproteobacteria bacterium]|nr:amidohydrolase family protein [Alphaproteobacteria bacterium]
MNSLPTFNPPRWACNSHCHVVGPRARYRVDENHPAIPPDSPAEALFALQKQLGFDRVVIVQSLAHGLDHSAAADAIAAYGSMARGIALLSSQANANEIADRSIEGFVGMRAHVPKMIPNAVGPERLAELGSLCADAGWHIELHLHGPELAEMLPVMARLPCNVVIDHMAYPNPLMHDDLFHAFDLANVFCKISCIERVCETDLTIGTAHAKNLIARAAEKIIWGNDWPHINVTQVDDVALVNILATIPSAARELILVDTPDRLYFHGKTK